MIRRDDHIAQADYYLTPARHRRDIAPADVDHQATTDRSRQRRVAVMGRDAAVTTDESRRHYLQDASAAIERLVPRLKLLAWVSGAQRQVCRIAAAHALARERRRSA